MPYTIMQQRELFWFDDPIRFIIDVNNASKFIPDNQMTLDEQLNAVVRFSIYFSILTLVIKRDYRILFFVVFTAFMTLVIRKYNENAQSKRKTVLEKLDLGDERGRGLCMKPTKENPFMNVRMSDYKDFPSRPPACNIAKRPVNKLAQNYFNDGLYRNVDDIFGRQASDRQFYTMPVTTIPNDQTKFAEWLYRAPGSTCKEKAAVCRP
jgi:hypothetical protein